MPVTIGNTNKLLSNTANIAGDITAFVENFLPDEITLNTVNVDTANTNVVNSNVVNASSVASSTITTNDISASRLFGQTVLGDADVYAQVLSALRFRKSGSFSGGTYQNCGLIFSNYGTSNFKLHMGRTTDDLKITYDTVNLDLPAPGGYEMEDGLNIFKLTSAGQLTAQGLTSLGPCSASAFATSGSVAAGSVVSIGAVTGDTVSATGAITAGASISSSTFVRAPYKLSSILPILYTTADTGVTYTVDDLKRGMIIRQPVSLVGFTNDLYPTSAEIVSGMNLQSGDSFSISLIVDNQTTETLSVGGNVTSPRTFTFNTFGPGSEIIEYVTFVCVNSTPGSEDVYYFRANRLSNQFPPATNFTSFVDNVI